MLATMSSVPTLDLSEQHRPLHDELHRAFQRVISSNRFVLGDEVVAFERAVAELSGVGHGVGVSSGSDALLAILMACGVGPGDEVVTTPYSFFATVEAIVRLGATPVFADVDPLTLNLDPALAAERIGSKTKAVLVVDLFGRPARLLDLAAVTRRAGIPLLEDAAQAIAADGIGVYGKAAALSFFPAKNLGGFGDGGMVLTNDGDFAAQIRLLRNHGASNRSHHNLVGGNFRLDELQAALLSVKLPRLRAWTRERRRVAATYRALLVDLPIGLPPEDDGAVWNQFVVRVPAAHRTALADHLAGRGVATSVYYPVPLHLQPALRSLGYQAGTLPHAERAARETLALPIYPELSDVGVAQVSEAIADFFSREARAASPS
jgi:dTDP-4-amino-4,6-dideoxygalactose transaminase